MDDRYADDEYRSSYPGRQADGAYEYPEYQEYAEDSSGQHPTGAYDDGSGQYPEFQEYAEYPEFSAEDVTAYEYDDAPPAAEPEPALPKPKIEPLDEDGVRAVEIGTLLWLIGFVGLLPFWGPLRSHGYTWWIWTCLAGFGLGAIGIELTRRRRARRAAGEDL